MPLPVTTPCALHPVSRLRSGGGARPAGAGYFLPFPRLLAIVPSLLDARDLLASSSESRCRNPLRGHDPPRCRAVRAEVVPEEPPRDDFPSPRLVHKDFSAIATAPCGTSRIPQVTTPILIYDLWPFLMPLSYVFPFKASTFGNHRPRTAPGRDVAALSETRRQPPRPRLGRPPPPEGCRGDGLARLSHGRVMSVSMNPGATAFTGWTAKPPRGHRL